MKASLHNYITFTLERDDRYLPCQLPVSGSSQIIQIYKDGLILFHGSLESNDQSLILVWETRCRYGFKLKSIKIFVEWF